MGQSATRKSSIADTRTSKEARPRAAASLRELRRARQLSQQELAESLGRRQSAISKIEQRSDILVSSLRRYIKGLGGRLEVVARFPEANVRISQFGDTEATSTEQAQLERWVATWQDAGPALDAEKRRELERLDTPTALAQLAAAFALALEGASASDTSGLAEQQRLFRRLAQ